MATHSSIPAWRIPWTEEPSGVTRSLVGSQGVRHSWETDTNHPYPYIVPPFSSLPLLTTSFYFFVIVTSLFYFLDYTLKCYYIFFFTDISLKHNALQVILYFFESKGYLLDSILFLELHRKEVTLSL